MNPPAFDNKHSPVPPLPFDPKNLSGLSVKLMQSHWENNYGGAVKALNTIRGRLTQALNDSNTPPYVYTGLKREQLLRTGSVVLHEAYFSNLGGSGKAGSDVRTRISGSLGTFDAWESEFRKIGQGLSGGIRLGRSRVQSQAQASRELLDGQSCDRPGRRDASPRHGHV